jgi:hypothetical protein
MVQTNPGGACIGCWDASDHRLMNLSLIPPTGGFHMVRRQSVLNAIDKMGNAVADQLIVTECPPPGVPDQTRAAKNGKML